MDNEQFWVTIWRTIGFTAVALALVATTAYNLGKAKEMDYLAKGGSAVELRCSQSADTTTQVYCLELARIKAAKQ